MAEEVQTTVEARDTLAGVVMQRFRRARDYREQYRPHQNKTASQLIERADKQYRREYTQQDKADMKKAFGFCPTRYLGIVQQKVNATVAWNSDLVVNNLDKMFTVTPSPVPTLDDASLERVRSGVRQELIARMMSSGIIDPMLLLTDDDEVAPVVEDFLRDQIRELQKVEQARIVGLASNSAKRAQTKMRDVMVEGKFRQAYSGYSFDRFLYGLGVIRFPEWRRVARLEHRGESVKPEWETIPIFRHARLKDFYPIADASDFQSNTGNTEVVHVTKAELISFSDTEQDGYFSDQIREIVEEFSNRSRDWLGFEQDDDRTDWWQLDDTIAMLIHEGYFSGDELKEYGIDGVDTMEYVNARIKIIGGRTIQAQLLRMPEGATERSYFAAPFTKIGDNLYDYIGMGAMLWDSEQRVNRLMHLFEHNVDWSSRPPVLTNFSVFENPANSGRIRPGQQYEVEENFAASRSLPEPVRTIRTATAQYHLIMTQVGAILRQADEDCGIPAFAYGSQDFGRSSLGEYSQRMTNALRMIKQAALNEDIFFIEPAFKSLFNYEMETDDELGEGQDVNVLVRGMTGLLQEDQKRLREENILPLVIQGAQSGVVPEQAVQYAVRSLLQQAGFPVEALGLPNPEIEQAFAAAAAEPVAGFTPGSQQVPPVDGRSRVPDANVATPEGASQFVPGVS